MIIAGTSGSAPDTIARVLAAKLTEAMGQQVVVDPRPGATGLIGAEIVAKSAPDGHTLWFSTLTTLVGTAMHQKHWLAKEYAPIGLFGSTAFGVAIHSGIPASTLAEFIAYAKTQPGKLRQGSSGQGSISHLCMEMIQSLAGINLVHVPYKGAVPALVDLAGGQVHASCQAIPALPLYVKTGRVRSLGVTTLKRTRIAPDVPPIADTLPGFEILGWYGLVAPLGTPKPIIAKVNAAVTKIAQMPDVQERLISAGAEALTATPEEFHALLQRETAKWVKLLREANIRPVE